MGKTSFNESPFAGFEEDYDDLLRSVRDTLEESTCEELAEAFDDLTYDHKFLELNAAAFLVWMRYNKGVVGEDGMEYVSEPAHEIAQKVWDTYTAIVE